MRSTSRSGSLVVFGLAAALALAETPPQPTPRERTKGDPDRDSAVQPDRIGPELQKRIRNQAELNDVRVDVEWPHAAKLTSARVYGNGVGIWDRKTQFRMSKPQVVSILETLQKGRFGSMPDHFGESEEEENDGRNEGPRLKGRIAVRAGWVLKTVIQLVDGEQSHELASLAEKLIAICQAPAQTGVGAENLTDGLKKLASGDLAPETLQVTVQRRFTKPNPEDGKAGWVLRLEGRRALAEVIPAGKTVPPQKLLTISKADFQSLVKELDASGAGEIPINVYAPEYTDFQLAVLSWSRSISARRFLNMTPETRGEKQQAFDHLYETLRALHERARKEGTTVPASTAARAREKEKQAAKEKS